MSGKTNKIGNAFGHPCHCICHYEKTVRHCAPCCDQVYQQYDESVMDEKALKEHIAQAIHLLSLSNYKDEINRKINEWNAILGRISTKP